MRFLKCVASAMLLTAPAWGANSYFISQEMVDGQPWRFHGLKAEMKSNGIEVSGNITAGSRAVLRSGHIDVAVFTSAGELVSETTVAVTLSPVSASVRKISKHGIGYFRTLMKGVFPKGAQFKVRFHREH